MTASKIIDRRLHRGPDLGMVASYAVPQLRQDPAESSIAAMSTSAMVSAPLARKRRGRRPAPSPTRRVTAT